MQIKSTIITAALAVFTLTAYAQTQDPAATPGIDKRQEVQQKRIDKGVESGLLTGNRQIDPDIL